MSRVSSNTTVYMEEPSKEEPKEQLEPTKKNYNDVYNGGYSWVMLFSAFVMQFCSWGNNAAFSIYLAHYISDETYDNGSRLDYAAVGGITFGLGLVLAPITNKISGRLGNRAALIIGNFFQTAALILTSVSSHHRIWQLYLCQGVLQSIGLVFIGVIAFSSLPFWFINKESPDGVYRFKDRMLSMSQGVGTSAVGMSFVYIFGMQKVIEVNSVEWALRAQAIINFGLLTLATILYKQKDQQNTAHSAIIDVELLTSPGTYLAISYFVCSGLGYVVCLYCMSDFTKSLGYSSNQATIAAAMVQIGALVGRPVVGILCDRFGAITIALCCYTLSGILALAMWIPARNYATVIVLCLVLGAIIGTQFSSFAAVVLNVVGFHMEKAPNMFSIIFCPFGVACIFSPIIGFALTKEEVSPIQFRDCSIFCGVAFFAAVLCLLFFRAYVISKDQLTAGKDLTSKQYMDISVPFRQWLSNMFVIHHTRKL